MSGMQAVTTMELEAMRRQEVLLASAPMRHRSDVDAKRESRRPIAILARLVVAMTRTTSAVLARI